MKSATVELFNFIGPFPLETWFFGRCIYFREMQRRFTLWHCKMVLLDVFPRLVVTNSWRTVMTNMMPGLEVVDCHRPDANWPSSPASTGLTTEQPGFDLSQSFSCCSLQTWMIQLSALKILHLSSSRKLNNRTIVAPAHLDCCTIHDTLCHYSCYNSVTRLRLPSALHNLHQRTILLTVIILSPNMLFNSSTDNHLLQKMWQTEQQTDKVLEATLVASVPEKCLVELRRCLSV